MKTVAIVAGPLEAMALEGVIEGLAWRSSVVDLGKPRPVHSSLQDLNFDIIVGAPTNGTETSELMLALRKLEKKPPTLLILRDLSEIEMIRPALEPHVSVLRFSGQVDEMRHVLQVVTMGNCVRPIGFTQDADLGNSVLQSEILEKLTKRERDVISSLKEGLSNKEIARSLGISRHTVGIHVGAIMRKFQARSRTEVVALVAGQPRRGEAPDRRH